VLFASLVDASMTNVHSDDMTLLLGKLKLSLISSDLLDLLTVISAVDYLGLAPLGSSPGPLAKSGYLRRKTTEIPTQNGPFFGLKSAVAPRTLGTWGWNFLSR
jgi:hypothetical protein